MALLKHDLYQAAADRGYTEKVITESDGTVHHLKGDEIASVTTDDPDFAYALALDSDYRKAVEVKEPARAASGGDA